VRPEAEGEVVAGIARDVQPVRPVPGPLPLAPSI